MAGCAVSGVLRFFRWVSEKFLFSRQYVGVKCLELDMAFSAELQLNGNVMG
jgi:hypothetical protein